MLIYIEISLIYNFEEVNGVSFEVHWWTILSRSDMNTHRIAKVLRLKLAKT